MRKPWVIFGILTLSLESTSCLRQKPQARVFAAPAPRVRVKPPADVVPSLPDAPEIAPDEASLTPPQVPGVVLETLDIPEAPKRVARRPVVPVTPANPPVAPPRETPVPPRLAQIFTPEQLRENMRTLDETLEKVARELAIVEGKNLTAEQKVTAERIRTFRKQAEQVREQDPLTAVSLARRADLLAKDLLEHLP